MFRPHNTQHAWLMPDWLMVMGLVLLWKQAYSAASAAQLQWLLYPLVVMLELFSDLAFADTGFGEWLDSTHQVSIVKACAGGNFLAIAWLGYLWRGRGQTLTWQRLSAALLLSWLTVIIVNTSRILLCVYGQDALAKSTGLTVAHSHQLIGVVVYFGCLWLQLLPSTKAGSGNAIAAATAIYLGVALVIPVLRAGILGLPQPSWSYALWAAGVPMMAVAVVGFVPAAGLPKLNATVVPGSMATVFGVLPVPYRINRAEDLTGIQDKGKVGFKLINRLRAINCR